VRVITCAVVALVLVALGAVQLASDAFCAPAAAAFSLPRVAPRAAALRVYAFLDRVAPAGYVEATLAQDALAHGRTTQALHYALRLAPSPVRNELLGRIALRHGDEVLAREYFFAAPDIGALQRDVAEIARRDPVAAYVFEREIRDRLASLQTHPDAVAESNWIMGTLAFASARREPATRRTWFERALGDDVAAANLSPLSEKYALAAAAAALQLGDHAAARAWYRAVRRIDPTAEFH
jgi:hypothetical protein